jgi:hypothetical protein
LLSSAPQFGLVLTIFWIDFRRFYHFWLFNSNFRPPPAMKPADFWAQYQLPQPVDECSSQLLFWLDSSSLSPSMNAAASFGLDSIILSPAMNAAAAPPSFELDSTMIRHNFWLLVESEAVECAWLNPRLYNAPG